MINFLINQINFLACDLFSDEEYQLISNAYHWILLIVPGIVVVLCTVDMAKAVMAQDENKMKEARNRSIKRIIAGMAVFFVAVLLNLILGAVSGDINLGGACISNI